MNFKYIFETEICFLVESREQTLGTCEYAFPPWLDESFVIRITEQIVFEEGYFFNCY